MFFGDGRDLLGDPCRGRALRRHKGVAKYAGGAGIDERLDACGHRLFQQVERSSHVDVNEFLTAVRGDVWLVQGGGMKDRLHAAHATPHASPIGDRADVRW